VTFVVDTGSYFEAPLDKVWAFVGSGPHHGDAHRHLDQRRTRETEHVGRYSWTQEFDGHPAQFTMRWHAFPPLGIAYEVLEGPFEGSTFFVYYTPERDRTGVTVVGEFVSPTLAPEAVAPAVLRFFALEFEQDRAAIRAFPAAEPDRRTSSPRRA
jgi:hypothetical protein